MRHHRTVNANGVEEDPLPSSIPFDEDHLNYPVHTSNADRPAGRRRIDRTADQQLPNDRREGD